MHDRTGRARPARPAVSRPQRLDPGAVGLVAALIIGAGAFRVARKRGISEIEP